MAVCWEEPMTAVPFSDTHFHSIATLRDEHATTFHSSPPPRVTPGVNLPRYYTPTLRLLLSPLLYFFSSCRSLSGFSRVRLCLCLSICVFICLTHIHLKGMLLSWMHRLSRQWEEIIPPCNRHTDTHNILHVLDYSGLETQSKVNSYWAWCIRRKQSNV